jgi:hypothetical protein
VSLEDAIFGPRSAPPAVETNTLIAAMLASGPGISDLIFSPGRAPQVEEHGDLVPVTVPPLEVLQPADTTHVARDVIAGSEQGLHTLK